MPRKIRTRDLTDRQLHEELAEVFASFSLARTYGTTLAASNRLEILLAEESRRLRDGRSVCVCEACAPIHETMGWPEPFPE
jgi:hypothetical protein